MSELISTRRPNNDEELCRYVLERITITIITTRTPASLLPADEITRIHSPPQQLYSRSPYHMNACRRNLQQLLMSSGRKRPVCIRAATSDWRASEGVETST